MDANFKAAGSSDITPSLRVRNAIMSRQDKDLVRLLAISGSNDVVNSCLANKIDARLKPLSLQQLYDFFIKAS
jgi:hypothetical protein